MNILLATSEAVPFAKTGGLADVCGALPIELARRFVRLERYGFIILIGLLYFGLFDKIIIPLVQVLTYILIGT